MVAEPKPHQTGRKRQNVAKTGNDWDYYYDSYYASTAFAPVGPPRLVPPLKRQRLMSTAVARNGKATPAAKSPAQLPPIDQLKTYSNPDILICGNCREMFTDLHDLLEHKKTYCKLRFTCKCDFNKSRPGLSDEPSSAALLCVQCKDAFANAWDLMVHAQAAHMLNIYELGVPALAEAAHAASGSCGSPPCSPRDSRTPDKDAKQAASPPASDSDPDMVMETADADTDPDLTLLSNGRHQDTPDSDLLEELSVPAKQCIMHALSIVSSGTGPQPQQPQDSPPPPPLAAIAPAPAPCGWTRAAATRITETAGSHEPY